MSSIQDLQLFPSTHINPRTSFTIFNSTSDHHTPTIRNTFPVSLYKITMTVPSTCCGRSGQDCVCAAQAKCSCGKQSALKCTCEKANTENTVSGARCSCRMSCPLLRTRCCRELALLSTPAIVFLSWRGLEYQNTNESNLAGARPAGECTCERAATENAKPAGSTCTCGARPAGKSFPNTLPTINPTTSITNHYTF